MLADLLAAGIEVHQIRCSQMSWNSQVLQQSSHPSLRRVHHPSHSGPLFVFSIDQPIEVLDSFGNLKRLGCIIRIYQMCYCLENVVGPRRPQWSFFLIIHSCDRSTDSQVEVDDRSAASKMSQQPSSFMLDLRATMLQLVGEIHMSLHRFYIDCCFCREEDVHGDPVIETTY